MIKRGLPLFVCLSAFAALMSDRSVSADPAAPDGSGPPAAAPAKYRLGVSLPLSGPEAALGRDVLRVLQFAIKKFGESRYALSIEDDRCDPSTAASVARKLVEVNKVDAVIGYSCSVSALAAAPVFDQAHVPMMIVYASSAQLRDAGDYIFRTWPSDAAAAGALYRYAARRNKGIALITEETPYAENLKESFIAANIQPDVEVRSEDFPPGTADFSSILLRTKAWSPGAILINSDGAAGFAQVLRQVRQIKWKGDIFGIYWPGRESVRAELKDLLDDVVYVDSPPLDQLLTADGWGVLSEYGKPLAGAPAAFCSTVEGFRALNAALTSGRDLRQYLYTAKFSGSFGDFSFDKNGEIEGFELRLQRIKNGKPEPVK